MSEMDFAFDFNSPAEVFIGGGRSGRHVPMAYRRFSTGAEAIRFAIERQSPANLLGTVVEADDVRLGSVEIRTLYDSASYPLPRRKPS